MIVKAFRTKKRQGKNDSYFEYFTKKSQSTDQPRNSIPGFDHPRVRPLPQFLTSITHVIQIRVADDRTPHHVVINRPSHCDSATPLRILRQHHPGKISGTGRPTNAIVQLEPAFRTDETSLLSVEHVIVPICPVQHDASSAGDLKAEFVVVWVGVVLEVIFVTTVFVPYVETILTPAVRLPVPTYKRAVFPRIAQFVGSEVLIAMPIEVVELVKMAFANCVGGILTIALGDVQDVAIVGRWI